MARIWPPGPLAQGCGSDLAAKGRWHRAAARISPPGPLTQGRGSDLATRTADTRPRHGPRHRTADTTPRHGPRHQNHPHNATARTSPPEPPPQRHSTDLATRTTPTTPQHGPRHQNHPHKVAGRMSPPRPAYTGPRHGLATVAHKEGHVPDWISSAGSPGQVGVVGRASRLSISGLGPGPHRGAAPDPGRSKKMPGGADLLVAGHQDLRTGTRSAFRLGAPPPRPEILVCRATPDEEIRPSSPLTVRSPRPRWAESASTPAGHGILG